MARGMLEADGIPAALLDAQVAALGLGPAVGGVRLLVPLWDEGRALELLSQPAWTPEGPSLTPWGPTPLPGSTRGTAAGPPEAPTPPPAPAGTDPGPATALAAPGPLALRVAVLVALALALAVLAALR